MKKDNTKGSKASKNKDAPTPEKDLLLFYVEPKEQQEAQDAFNYKIDEVTFWGVMMAAFGIASKAVKIFARDYDIKVSRQAVWVRSNAKPDMLQQCRESMLDAAEEVGIYLLHNADKRTQAEIYKHMTSKLGSGRGYASKTQTEHSGEIKVERVEVDHITTGVPFANSEKDIK